MCALVHPSMKLEDFLAWEELRPDRHEFYRGEIFAMVGGRRTHGRVVVNLLSAFHMQLKGSPFQVFGETMKLQIDADTVLYPDVFVTCDKADLAAERIFRAPTLVVEVLSPSTQGYDRSQKFALYRRVASLQEYILIDPDTRRIESFRRGADGFWVLHDLSDGDTLKVASVDLQMSAADLFEGAGPATET